MAQDSANFQSHGVGAGELEDDRAGSGTHGEDLQDTVALAALEAPDLHRSHLVEGNAGQGPLAMALPVEQWALPHEAAGYRDAPRTARTSETEARRSVAITGAPVNSLTPRTIAEAPCTLMLAPIRQSSGTCMNRFSKIVSVIIAAPSAVVIRAIICACRSVGKPGNGSVITSTPPIRPVRRWTNTPPGVGSTGTPAPSRTRITPAKAS